MQEIIAHDANGDSLTSLVQWDSDVYIYLSADNIDDAYKVHFFNSVMDESLAVDSEYSDGILKVKIPNYLLSQPYIICGYVSVVKNGETKSLYSFKINIRKKPKPTSYLVDGSPEWVDIETIIDELRAFAINAAQDAKDAAERVSMIEYDSMMSKSYAVGGTGTRDGEDEDNAKYYYEMSIESANNACAAAKTAEECKESAGVSEENAAEYERSAKECMDKSEEYKNSSEAYKNDAESCALKSEEYKNAAEGYKDDAAMSAKYAEDYKNSADTLKQEASTFAGQAEEYKNSAEEYKNEAADFAEQAGTYLGDVEQAANDAAGYAAEAGAHADSIKSMSRWANAITDDVTHFVYFIGIENGAIYLSDEFT